MADRRPGDLRGTLLEAFEIGDADLDASGLTAARTHALPDHDGTIMTEGTYGIGGTVNLPAWPTSDMNSDPTLIPNGDYIVVSASGSMANAPASSGLWIARHRRQGSKTFSHVMWPLLTQAYGTFHRTSQDLSGSLAWLSWVRVYDATSASHTALATALASDFATPAQGALADSALQPGGPLGTPSSGTLTSCTGLPNAAVVGLGTAALVADSSLVHLAGTETMTGAKSIAGAFATPLTLNRTDSAVGNVNVRYQNTSGSVWAGMHGSATNWSIGGNADLTTAVNRWMTVDANGMNGVLGATTPAAATVTTLTVSASATLGDATSDAHTVWGDVRHKVASAKRFWIDSADNGQAAVSQSSVGMLLTAAGMNNSTAKYTPGILFGSTDPQFTTTNPKWLAGIFGYARENYTSDTVGAMGLEFFGTAGAPGTAPVPASLGTWDINTLTSVAAIAATTTIKTGSYTVATLPSAASAGRGAGTYCTDETGGEIPVFSDGTNWRRVSDRTIAA